MARRHRATMVTSNNLAKLGLLALGYFLLVDTGRQLAQPVVVQVENSYRLWFDWLAKQRALAGGTPDFRGRVREGVDALCWATSMPEPMGWDMMQWLTEFKDRLPTEEEWTTHLRILTKEYKMVEV